MTPVAHDSWKDLPAPVSRYFKHVLADDQRPIGVLRMAQSGQLRADLHRDRWMSFVATHVVRPMVKSFCWDARVRLLPLVHLRVRDAYANSIGSGRVQLMSAVTVASDSNGPELNSGSLHRYLAEAVWYPTALLPSAGVQWRAIDDRKALATVSDAESTVSLEFRFNAADEIVAVYTPRRWMRAGKAYEQHPWEGHFGAYRRHDRMLVPFHGEVGWHTDARLEIVWKGDITSFEYEFGKLAG